MSMTSEVDNLIPMFNLLHHVGTRAEGKVISS